MMAGNPSWWSFSDKAQQPSAFLPPCPSLFPQFAPGSSSLLPFNSSAHHDHIQEFPFSQLLMGGLASEEGDDNKYGGSTEFHDQQNRLENWEEHQQQQQQQILISPSNLLRVPAVFDVKQEESNNNCWSQLVMGGVSSSPRSSVTTTTSATSSSSNILDFSNNKADNIGRIIHHPDHSSSECNSTAAGGVSKKARVHSSSTQPPLKVRKEKLGDRITALHQLVSPFGKTDTASVLLEAIGYIGFLQGQIEALSSPYLGNGPQNIRHQQSGKEDAPKDLRSRGLCLVPISCTQHVGSENGADYWAPAPGGGF